MTAKQLTDSILQLAIQGKLVPQNPNDEPASVLLDRIREEKKRLVKEGKLKKKDLVETPISEDEKPFEIPESWEWVRFSSLYWLLTDGTHSTPKYKENGVPFLSVKDMSSGKLSFSNTKYISEEEHSVLSQRCHPQKGDLLLSKVGTTGIPLIIDTDREFSIFVSLALIKFFTHLIDSHYLLILINSPLVQAQVKENTRGVGNKNWVLSAISNTIMALPPLNEQRRIVAKIAEVHPLINEYGASYDEEKKFNTELPEKLRKSILQEAIMGKLGTQDPNDEPASVLLDRIREEKKVLVKAGTLKKKDLVETPIDEDMIPHNIPDNWIWTTLSNINVLYTGNSINETEKATKYTNVEGMDYIGTKDVQFDHSINYNNGVNIPSCYQPSFKKAPKGSVLMCIEGGSAGRKIGLLDREVCFGNKLCCFNPIVVEGKYIYYYLQSPVLKEAFSSNMNGIIGGVSINKLSPLLIPLPPLAEQHRIVEKIEALFAEVDHIEI